MLRKTEDQRWETSDTSLRRLSRSCGRLRFSSASVVDPNNTASEVWADTAYRSAANEAFLRGIGKVSRIHIKEPRGKAMPSRTARANARKSAVRARVEHPFTMLKGPMRLMIRTIGQARAEAAVRRCHENLRLAALSLRTMPSVTWRRRQSPISWPPPLGRREVCVGRRDGAGG